MDIEHRVHQLRVKNARHIFGRPAANAGNTAPLFRLQSDDAHRFILLAQKTRYAGNGAGGTHAGDKMGDPPVGLLPDFRPGSGVVRVRVVRVVELIEQLAFAALRHG